MYGFHIVHRGSIEQVLFSRFNTTTIVLKDIGRLDFYPNCNFIPIYCDIKSIGLMNVKVMNKIKLVLAHRLHWGFILNPKVLVIASEF